MLIPLLLFPINQPPLMNNHYLHCVPCHHTKLIKPKTATPLISTTTKTELEPISLELFNHAAADLDRKGEIEIEHYKKYLFNRD